MKGFDEKKYYKHYKKIKLGRTIWVLYLFLFQSWFDHKILAPPGESSYTYSQVNDGKSAIWWIGLQSSLQWDAYRLWRPERRYNLANF